MSLFPIGPLKVNVKLPAGASGKSLRLLVADHNASVSVNNGWANFEVKSVADHEVVVLT